jgi:hypothetical protein
MKAAEDYGPAIHKGGEDEEMTMHRSSRSKKRGKRGGKRKARRRGSRR